MSRNIIPEMHILIPLFMYFEPLHVFVFTHDFIYLFPTLSPCVLQILALEEKEHIPVRLVDSFTIHSFIYLTFSFFLSLFCVLYDHIIAFA